MDLRPFAFPSSLTWNTLVCPLWIEVWKVTPEERKDKRLKKNPVQWWQKMTVNTGVASEDEKKIKHWWLTNKVVPDPTNSSIELHGPVILSKAPTPLLPAVLTRKVITIFNLGLKKPIDLRESAESGDKSQLVCPLKRPLLILHVVIWSFVNIKILISSALGCLCYYMACYKENNLKQVIHNCIIYSQLCSGQTSASDFQYDC